MAIDKKILEEIRRHKSINNYITEQEATDLPPAEGGIPPPVDAGLPPEEGGLPPAPGAPPADAAAPAPPAAPAPQPVDVANDPDVEEVGKEGDETEELDITDLVNSQKNIEDKQEEFFNNLFQQIQNMESKLGEMDNIVNAINNLETKVEKMRPKTPQEKLELRSLDSGPFNQKLSDFFIDKEEDMEKSGKNEYVLTTDEVEDYSPSEIKGSFDTYDDEDMMP
jgi:hypothetical protein